MKLAEHFDPAAGGSGEGLPAIRDDRELLDELHLSDAEAAMFLTKSRQALNNQLGPRRADRSAPAGSFRFGEIVLLVAGARQLDRSIDVAAVKAYIGAAYPDMLGGKPHALLLKLLEGEPETIDLAGASTVVLLLPAFADLRAARGDVATSLLDLARALPEGDAAPAVFLLSSTEMQAHMAGQWLGLDRGGNCLGSDLVDHYLPTVLAYWRDRDEARPYVLTDRGTFEAVPRFRNNMVADCVRSMMPSALRQHLSPAASPGTRADARAATGTAPSGAASVRQTR